MKKEENKNAMYMRELTNSVLDNKQALKAAYDNAIDIIEQTAQKGKCYVPLEAIVNTEVSSLTLHVKYRLLADGFKIISGDALGKVFDYRDYIVW